VQFYDVVIDGERHPRNAWIYERPQPAMQRSRTASGSGKTSRSADTDLAIFAKSFGARRNSGDAAMLRRSP
jgi:hypothetical protein